MLVIRFFRTGKKNQPFFKIVVTEKTRPPRGGRFVEELGFYNPITKEKKLKADRIKYWLSKGAKLSDTVHNLLVKEGVLGEKKIAKHKKKKVKEKKEEVVPAAAGAPAAAGEQKPVEEKAVEVEKAAEAGKPTEKPAETGPPETEKSAEAGKPTEKLDK